MSEWKGEGSAEAEKSGGLADFDKIEVGSVARGGESECAKHKPKTCYILFCGDFASCTCARTCGRHERPPPRRVSRVLLYFGVCALWCRQVFNMWCPAA